MEDLKSKVLEGLDRCGAIVCKTGCPYATDGGSCIEHLCQDAARMIRGEEARLLTRGQLLALEKGTVVWREFRYYTEDSEQAPRLELEPIMRTSCCGAPSLVDGDSQSMIETLDLEPDEEGSQERYWSARPTPEQQMATPWEVSAP